MDLGATLSSPAYWGLLIGFVLVGSLLTVALRVSPVTVTLLVGLAVAIRVDHAVNGIVIIFATAAAANVASAAVSAHYPCAYEPMDQSVVDGVLVEPGQRPSLKMAAVLVAMGAGGIAGLTLMAGVGQRWRETLSEFAFPDIALLGIFAVLVFSALHRGAMVKGVIAGLVGILFGLIGVNAVTGGIVLFRHADFAGGLPFIAAVVGVIAVPDAIWSIVGASGRREAGQVNRATLDQAVRESPREWPSGVKQFAFVAQGSLLPMTGVAGGASLVLVGELVRSFGLGVGPGSVDAETTTVLAITLIVSGLLACGLGLWSGRAVRYLDAVPLRVPGVVVLAAAFVVAFASGGSLVAIAVMLVFGAIGLLFKAGRWPRLPIVIGMAVAGLIDGNLTPGLGNDGAWGVASRPVSVALGVTAIVLVGAFLAAGRYRQREPRSWLALVDLTPRSANDGWRHMAEVAVIAFAVAAGIVFVLEAGSLPDLGTGGLPGAPMRAWAIAVIVLAIVQLVLTLVGRRFRVPAAAPPGVAADVAAAVGIVAIAGLGAWVASPAWAAVLAAGLGAAWFARSDRLLVWAPAAALVVALLAFAALGLPLSLQG